MVLGLLHYGFLAWGRHHTAFLIWLKKFTVDRLFESMEVEKEILA
jgi:hypothetical protein